MAKLEHVFKSDCPESDGVYSYVSAKSEGRLFCASEPIDKGDYWEVEVATCAEPSSPGVLFPSDNSLSEAEIQKQMNQFSEQLSERPYFDTKGAAPDVVGWQPGVATDLGNYESVVESASDKPKSDLEKHNDELQRMLDRLKPY